MSGAQSGGGGGPDPSMEDILASIRRILNEDDAGPAPPREPPQDPRMKSQPEVFALDASMMVPEPSVARRIEPPPLEIAPPEPEPEPARQEPRLEVREFTPNSLPPEPPPVLAIPAPPPAPPLAPAEPVPPSWPASLVAPEAAAAAALSVGSLRRTLEAGRASLSVRSGGPTLDDMVREELRPVLKAWLDANLAPMVERLVRAEIERVVGRADL